MNSLFGEGLYLPFRILEFLRNRAYEIRCRSNIRVAEGARLLSGARVHNIRGDRDAIIIGAHSVIRGELLTFAHGGSIQIGDWCYLGEASKIWSAASIRIGNRVLIAHNVNIQDTNSHPIEAGKRHRHFSGIIRNGHPTQCPDISSRPIVIEDDAWVGFNSIILKGVTIGAASIVGAGSVVLRDVPPGSLFVGTEVRNRR